MYVAFYYLEFTDGGPAEAVILYEGSKEACIETADIFPGVVYSGSRPFKCASVAVCTKEKFESVEVKPS
jgi:hypothetical protein